MDRRPGGPHDRRSLHWPGRSPLGGEFRGRDAVLALLAKMGELTDSMEFVDHDFTASDTHTVALSRLKATRGDRTLEYDACEVVRWSDGKVVEEWIMVDDHVCVRRILVLRLSHRQTVERLLSVWRGPLPPPALTESGRDAPPKRGAPLR